MNENNPANIELQQLTEYLIQFLQSHPESFQELNEKLMQLRDDLRMEAFKLLQPAKSSPYENSRSMVLLSQYYGENFTTLQLTKVCINLASWINVKLERNVLRQKENMINWLDQNFEALSSFLVQQSQ